MRNLASNKDCDVFIAEELRRAKIDAYPCETNPGEVPSRLVGRLGPVEFWRASTYWVVEGPVPVTLATELYEDPIGSTGTAAAPPSVLVLGQVVPGERDPRPAHPGAGAVRVPAQESTGSPPVRCLPRRPEVPWSLRLRRVLQR